MQRRLAALFLAMLGVAAPRLALAQTSLSNQAWPSKPVKVVVPFAPGGGIDVMARLMSAKLQASLNTPVIVENRGGVGGVLGSDYVAKQPADGHTILFNTNGQAISAATFKTLPFDPVRDFTAVTQLYATNLLLAGSKKLAARNFRELVALAKSKPGALNYGSSGIGNPLHLTMELLKLKAGMDIQMVPYKSDGEIINALLGGQVDVGILPLVNGKEQVLAGALNGIAVTASYRARGLDVPTIAEQGLAGFEAGGWQALFVAAKTPDEIVKRIQVEARKAFQSPDIQPRVETFALTDVFSTPEEFAAFYRSEIENFKRIVREANIPLQE